MTSRELPPGEWSKLNGTEAESIWPNFDPANTRVLVVEQDGEIIGTWTLLRVCHAECIWIHPDHRLKGGVGSRLLKGIRKLAKDWGARRIVTGSVTEQVTKLIAKVGGFPMPCPLFVLPVDPPMTDREKGQQFHQRLETLIHDPPHDEDPDHDRQVGRALTTAIDGQEPARAVAEYNTWAEGAGYAPIKFLGIEDGKLIADIVVAVIEVDRDYTIRARTVRLREGELCH